MGNNKLREIRTGLGLSQLQLSFLSRVPNCVISDFERGIRTPWPKAKKLLAEAEKIAKSLGLTRIQVTSGIGVRDYYRKLGYRLEKNYMKKTLF